MSDVGSWLQYGAVSTAFVFGARALFNAYNSAPQPDGAAQYCYLPWPGTVLSMAPDGCLLRPGSSSLLLPASLDATAPAASRPGGDGTAALIDHEQPASGGHAITHRLQQQQQQDAPGDGAAVVRLGTSSSSDELGEQQQQSKAVWPDDVVVVDCTHPTLPTLTHHKDDNNPAALNPSDTSTGLVLNALSQARGWALELGALLGRRCVTTNHFDADAFLAVWAYTNREAARQHEPVLRHMARIGDFREAFLSPDLITAHGAHDGVTFIREAYTALKLVCWLNTLERRLFTAPYEAQGDCEAKMCWFLPRFEAVLADPESAWGDWQAEYSRVVSGFDLLAGPDCMVEIPPGLGLAVLTAPEPLHYVSLFSHSIGCDVVLMMYEGHRYEVEAKYTQFVRLASRPVWPRLDMAPLAAVLNQLEARAAQQQQSQQPQAQQSQQQQQQQQQPYVLFRSNSSGSAYSHHHTQPQPQQQQQAPSLLAAPNGSLRWVANSLTDTGPLLRLQAPGEVLSKAQRYGQPYERVIHSSAIPPHKMQAIVQSFLGFGLQGLEPKPGGWEWQELQELNAQIGWQDWASCILQQASSGELDQLTAAAAGGGTRAPSSLGGAIGGSTAGVAGGPSTPRRPLLHPEAWQQQQQQQQVVEMQPLAGHPAHTPSSSGGAAVQLLPGLPLPAAEVPPVLSQPSVVASPAALAALAAALPPLHRGNPWLLIYSTARDGISLSTLMRKAEKVAPSLLLVADSGGGVFGAYVADAWRHAPRFYGTGESFVFQLEPQRLLWPWAQPSGTPGSGAGGPPAPRNDFFQFASHELLGVGGCGHWALTLDEDLLRGSSGGCGTFASPCLASREEFEVHAVELWHVH